MLQLRPKSMLFTIWNKTYWKVFLYKLWSDETKLEYLGHNDKKFVWRHQVDAFILKYTISILKHERQNVMFWGYFSAKIARNLVRLNYQKKDYWEVLDINLKASIRNLKLKQDWIFIHDYNPKQPFILI